MKNNVSINIHNKSIFEYNDKWNDMWFVIGMEILDNMPHDRLYKDTEKVQQQWQYQVMVDVIQQDGEEELIERLEPITDPWYAIMSSYYIKFT